MRVVPRPLADGRGLFAHRVLTFTTGGPSRPSAIPAWVRGYSRVRAAIADMPAIA